MPPILDVFNQALRDLLGPFPTDLPYLIEFSGFIPVQGNARLIARVHAYPVMRWWPDKLPPKGGDHPYLLGIVRGVAWGWYNPGENFNLVTRDERGPITDADILDPIMRWAVVQDVLDAAHRIVDLARQVCAQTDPAIPLTIPHA